MTATIILLGTGPTLTQTWTAADDLNARDHQWPVVAVNQAVLHTLAPAWWVWGDYQLFDRVWPRLPAHSRCLIGQCVSDNGIDHLRHHGFPTTLAHRNWRLNYGVSETQYSIVAALPLARELAGGRRCRVLTHGVRFEGQHHYDDQPGDDTASGCTHPRHMAALAHFRTALRRHDIEWIQR